MISSGPNSKFIQQIIEKISDTKLNHTRLFVAKYPIGLDSRAKAIESLLDIKSNDIRMVGIHGLGGKVKLQLQKLFITKLLINLKEVVCLRMLEKSLQTNDGIIQLQENLLSKILRDKHLKVDSVAEGINMI